MQKKANHRLFFAITFALTWLFWLPAALSGIAEPAPLVLALHYLGGAAPLLVTIFLLYTRHTPEMRRDYWQRVFDFRRIGMRWYAVILLSVPALTGAGTLLDMLLGGSGGELAAAARFVLQPWAVAPFALFMLLFGPLPEELAWRGYTLDSLQRKRNALASSLILGAVWTLWHLPLFFIAGSYQHGLGVGTLAFWLFMLDKIPQSVIMTWIYNNNRRSTLSAVLLHFMVNFVGELFDLSPRAEVFYIAVWFVTAIMVVMVWGAERLMRE